LGSCSWRWPPTAADPPLAWDAHSTPLDLAATLGWPAALAFAAVLALALRGALARPRDRLQLALACALAATCLDALTVSVEDFRHVWLLCGLALAAPDASLAGGDRLA
jgi:hypothetical protein